MHPMYISPHHSAGYSRFLKPQAASQTLYGAYGFQYSKNVDSIHVVSFWAESLLSAAQELSIVIADEAKIASMLAG